MILIVFDLSRVSLFVSSLQRRFVVFFSGIRLENLLRSRTFSELASTDVFKRWFARKVTSRWGKSENKKLVLMIWKLKKICFVNLQIVLIRCLYCVLFLIACFLSNYCCHVTALIWIVSIIIGKIEKKPKIHVLFRVLK